MAAYSYSKEINHFPIITQRLPGAIARIFAILILVAALVGASPTSVSAAGTTFYIDNTRTCSETTQVGTYELPFCTIGRGALKALPGDTVMVLAGTYPETVIPKSGAAGLPITYRANPQVTVTGRPGTSTVNYSAFAMSGVSYVVIDGFNITRTSGVGIYADLSNHLTITNNHVTYAGTTSLFHPYEQGIVIRATTDSVISGNTTDHNTCIGIRLVKGSDYNIVNNNTSFANFSADLTNPETDAAGIEMIGSSHNEIINNTTFANEDSGINLYIHDSSHLPSSYNLVVGNLSYGNGDHGIDNNNSPYNTLIGNTVQGNGTVGINFEGGSSPGSNHATVLNNISVGNGFTPPSGSFGGNLRVDTASVTGTIIDYNIFNRENASVQIIWNNVNYLSLSAFRAAVAGQETHGLEGDPLFVAPVPSVLRDPDKYVRYRIDPTPGDYHLHAGSLAIDSANSNAPNEPLLDIEGNTRVDDPATPNTGAGVRLFDDRGAYEFQPAGMSLPTVTTQAVTDITATTATGNGMITALGVPNPTDHGVAWSTSANPTTADNKTTQGPIGATGLFTSSISGLNPNTLYHMRAYATNTQGTAYGEDVTFTTPALLEEYSLTLNTIGNGAVTANPLNAHYHYGDIVSLTALPGADWHLESWSTNVMDGKVTITGNTTVTATFAQNEYTLTVISAHGKVTKNPNQATYHAGDVVSLNMTVDPGWTFTGWTPALTGNQVTIDGNTTVTANFTPIKYTLALNIIGGGTITADKSAPYYYGDVIHLTAIPNTGWNFINWSGSTTGTTNPVSLVIMGNSAVTATFAQNEYTLTVVSDHGTVTRNPDQSTYHNGDVVTLGIVADPGWTFASWTPVLTSNQVTINGNTTVTANFTPIEYVLTVNSAHGLVTKEPYKETYQYGDVVTLSVTPNPGWIFTGWTPALSGNQITITGNTTVSANFTQIEYTLSLNVIGSGTITASKSAPYYYNDVITLAATPAQDWSFSGWSGNVIDGKVTITGNTTVTATFTQNGYTLTVNSAHGTVTRSPNLATYHAGDVVTLSMTADPGWTFDGWTPTLVDNQVTIAGNTTVTANFTPIEYTLTVNSAHGPVTKSPDQATYHYGDVVTLSVTADPGWTFTGWTPALSGNQVTITGDTTITANFTQNTYTLTLNTSGSGTISSDKPGPYHYGDVVTLTALPADGWYFANWSGAVTGTTNPAALTMDGNKTVTATFQRSGLTISGNAGAEGVTLSYPGGTPVTTGLDGAYSISVPYNWSGTITPSKAGYIFTPANLSYRRIKIDQVGQNYTIIIAPPAIPVTVSPSGTINTATPSYTWVPSDRADYYLLSVYNQSRRTYVSTDVLVEATACTINLCTYTPNVLLGNYSYKFSVAAVNDGGSSGYGNLKNWLAFTVQVP